jgi:exonuclease SbcD
MFKFVHAADLHIDSPLEGLDRYEGAPVDRVRVATREATKNLVRLAVEQEAKFVLLCGDVYDGDWKDYNTGLFFLDQLAELARHGIRAFVVHGNHDAESQITRSLRPPQNTTVLTADQPQTIEIEELGVAIHGQSFDKRAVTRDLQAGYPKPLRGLFNIGMLHTAASGRPGHQPYAPCRVEDLQSKGYDYWALGHVHTREVLSKKPWIVFPGNTQGRHARELGPKGCSVVAVEDGQVASVDHRDLDVVRWVELELDATDAQTADDVLDRVRPALEGACDGAGDRLYAVRLVVRGVTAAHPDLASRFDAVTQQVRATANELANVWVEKVILRATPPRDRAGQGDESLLSLLASLERVADEESVRAEIQQVVEELRSKVAKLVRQDEDGGPFGTSAVDEALAEAVSLLRARLGGQEP